MVVVTELLPKSSSSSSSTHDHNHIYDVFLSFKGADTRNSFTDHLYNALLDAGIRTFLDDEEIETGEPLKPELESAIRSSKASIIILSKNYASSTWCLDELVLLLEQKRNFNQIFIPIFYHVEPTDVRKQQSSFGEAMEKHKQRMEEETKAEKRNQMSQKMELWKRALTQAADIKGKDAKNRKETEFISEVVTELHCRLGVSFSNFMTPLIGMDYNIKRISSWLTDESCHTVDILSIVGMSGIGKTSLVKCIFQLHSSKFDKSSFIEGINGRCNERFNGLLDLQMQLHEDISKKTPLKVNDVSVYTSKIENILARKIVFIVLDDIGTLDQLDAFLGNKGLHPGSKVIVSTKNASLTKGCALFKSQVYPKHREVLLDGLCKIKSLQLFCIHAFKSKNPKEGYEKVSEKLVKYCDGHPLALEVLGKSLYERDVAYWEEWIKVLKKETHSHINKTLQMSYDSLPFDNYKELFKHIACFFVGEDRELIETILNACDFETKSGISILIDRCLLSIGQNNRLIMHSLIQEMGRDLVRLESSNMPWNRSRLWCHKESFQVLKQKKGSGNIIGLALDMRMLDKNKSCGSYALKMDSLSNMHNLMLLQLNYVQLNGCFENFPEELRWLCMQGSPLKSIPLDLPMENLIALDMSYSNIEYFDMSSSNPQPRANKKMGCIGSSSNDKRLLRSLKILDLSFCQQLHTVGGFFELPALKRLIVTSCIRLIEVCESVEQCVELVSVDLSHCYRLKKIPISLGKLKNLKTLLLDRCNSQNPSSPNMKAIPSDLKFLAISLPSSLVFLSLADNNLTNESFPMDLSCLAMLKELCLDKNPIVSMPNCVRTLPRLEILYMEYCDILISIENPPRTLRKLSIFNADLNCNTFLRKIKFDPEMSLLEFFGIWCLFMLSSSEIDGIIKTQAMTGVEEKVLRSLGWINLDFIKERHLKTSGYYKSIEESQTQMYHEFGIFSTFYEGDSMPSWISLRSKGPSISFTIPFSLNKLRGLNFCCVEMGLTADFDFKLPSIKISNTTKGDTWIYKHYIHEVRSEGTYLSLLSDLCLLTHWMFGPNDMEGGDHITINVEQILYNYQLTMECGIGLVYDEDGKNEEEEEEEEDALSYYKSWNHIIGGDLSDFQLTTGEYFLDNRGFEAYRNFILRVPFMDYEECFYKEEKLLFKAFSKTKSEILGFE